MPTDPTHQMLGFTPEGEKSSLGPVSTLAPNIGGAHYYPGFKDELTKWMFLEAAYKGGPSFKEGTARDGQPIFVKHERENDTRYARRRSVTTYRNYVGPIVDQYGGYVGTSKVVRSGRDKFKEWMADCDSAGTQIQDYFIHALVKGLLLGQWWGGVDLPRVETRTAETDLTRRPYLLAVHPVNVVDYEVDGKDKVKRIVIHHTTYEKKSFGDPTSVRHEFHEWTETELIIWKPKNDNPAVVMPSPDGATTAVPQPALTLEKSGTPIAHGFGRVPFARLKVLEGKGIAEDIAESNKTVLNLTALLIEELYNNTFTQMFVSGAEDDEQGEVKNGTSTIIFLANPEAKIHSVGADAQQAQSLMNALFMEVKEIHRMAHMEQGGEPLQKRVAEAASKLEKSHESMDQILESLADALQRFENELLSIAAGMQTPFITKEDVKTVWPKIFDTKTLREKIALAIEMDTVPFCPAEAKKALARQIIEEMLEGTPEAKAALAEVAAAQGPRTPNEIALMKMAFEAGAAGPIQIYQRFVDPTASPQQAAEACQKIAEERTKFAPQTTGAGDATAKPPNRPQKQPTPAEQAVADANTQKVNQA